MNAELIHALIGFLGQYPGGGSGVLLTLAVIILGPLILFLVMVFRFMKVSHYYMQLSKENTLQLRHIGDNCHKASETMQERYIQSLNRVQDSFERVFRDFREEVKSEHRAIIEEIRRLKE